MKRRNVGGQSPARWSQSEDLRGGKATCEGNKGKQMRGEMRAKAAERHKKQRRDIQNTHSQARKSLKVKEQKRLNI